MKKLFLMLVAIITMATAKAVTFEGSHYEGIAKMAGQPIDFWTVLNFDDEDAMFNLANQFKLSGQYTAKTVGTTTTLTVKMSNGKTETFKTSDNGGSLEGTLSANGNSFKVWLLKVPAKKVASTLPNEELASIIGSKDGYTAFVKVNMNGAEMSATSDFTFNSANNSFKMTCDSQVMQKIFGTMQGTYSVEGARFTSPTAQERK